MTAMLSTMMNTPLGVSDIASFWRASFCSSSRSVITMASASTGAATTRSIADSARSPMRLRRLGLSEGDRVGTFMWNSSRHLEAYLAVPSMGAVLHTVNCRLSPEHMRLHYQSCRGSLSDRGQSSGIRLVASAAPDSKVEYLIVTGDAASLE